MNGELYDLCRIALAGQKALKEKTAFEPDAALYILDRRFVFSEGFGCTENEAQWFKTCVKRGMHDMKLIVPFQVKNRSLLGFVNQTGAYLILFREKRGASAVTSRWEYDQQAKGWHVVYREEEWVSSPVGVPAFADETEDFRKVLKEIEGLANELKEPYFARRFQEALAILEGRETPELSLFPDIPQPYKRILDAVSSADVFGAMGSWNDCPPGEAKELGKEREYEALSNELLKQIRLAILYAVNSCYMQ